MLILKGKDGKGRILEYVRMGMGPMVRSSVCFEYTDGLPVIHNSLYLEKEKYSLKEFCRLIEEYLEEDLYRYIFVYTNEVEEDLQDLIDLLERIERDIHTNILLTCK